MPETRAYKLNEQRQPGSRPGTLIYYYYGPDGRLTSQEVSEELFDALSDMDEKFYALERREEYHNVRHLKPSPHNHVFCPRKIEDLPDKKMAYVLQQQEDSADLLDARALFRGDDKRIYRMHFLEKLTQELQRSKRRWRAHPSSTTAARRKPMPSDNGNNSSRSSARKTTRISCSISSAASAVPTCRRHSLNGSTASENTANSACNISSCAPLITLPTSNSSNA